ncbi:MAG: methionyl-tRNA formyltransferase [Candidatus Omnitrophota bacterium]|jgi:methionyl-tRNA formyltransferase
MKIFFFGTGNFGIPALEAISKSEHELAAVVLPPSKPQGRGRKVKPAPIEVWAQSKNIEIQYQSDVNSAVFLDSITQLKPDLFLVVSLGIKLSTDFLNLPTHQSLNIHPSLLPQYRGASPIPQALYDGKKIVGTTIMRMGQRMDAGDILNQSELILNGNENALEVWGQLAELSADCIMQVIDQLVGATCVAMVQDENKATFCTKLSKENASINWSKSAADIHNQVRAYFIWPGSQTTLKQEPLKIIQTQCLDMPTTTKPPGTIVQVDKLGLDIQTGRSILRILKLQKAGSKPMDIASFLNGNALEVDMCLGE